MPKDNDFNPLKVSAPPVELTDVEKLIDGIQNNLKKPIDFNNENIINDITILLKLTGSYFFKALDPKIALNARDFVTPDIPKDFPFLFSGTTTVPRTNMSSGMHQKYTGLAKILNLEYIYNGKTRSLLKAIAESSNILDEIEYEILKGLGMNHNVIVKVVDVIKEYVPNYRVIDHIPAGTPQMMFPVDNSYVVLSPTYHQGFLSHIHNTKFNVIKKDGSVGFSKWKNIKVGSNNPQNGGILPAFLGGWYRCFKSIPRVKRFNSIETYLYKVSVTNKLFHVIKLNQDLLDKLDKMHNLDVNNIDVRNREKQILRKLVQDFLEKVITIKEYNINIPKDITGLNRKYLLNQPMNKSEIDDIASQIQIAFVKSVKTVPLTQSNMRSLESIIIEEMEV